MGGPAGGAVASLARGARARAPGTALCLAVALAALGLQHVEEVLFGRAWLEALVLAILIGAAVRTIWSPPSLWRPGVAFCARTVLEVAVVLLGVSLSLAAIRAAGLDLVGGIALVVALALGAGYAIGRGLGLPHRMAVLVACGNAICGNSAIAAVAPVIGADGKDVAASIAFTAVLGVLVVLGLPLVAPLMSPTQYGVLAGLTVYAVPQVLAATAPVAPLSAQVGTLVKLVRVLMLGPVVLVLSLLASRSTAGAPAAPGASGPPRPRLRGLVPWFIVAFLALAALRSADLVPTALLAPAARLAGWLTVVAMAALGLGVDARTVARAGVRVTLAVTLSLAALAGVAVGLIRVLGVA